MDAWPTSGAPRASLVAAVCFALVVLIQFAAGAWRADFNLYPDEASHMVGAVMIHDWIASGQWTQPVPYAVSYYEHYPYFAVGYWPILFHTTLAFWFLAAGVGRFQALLLVALFTAATAWLIYRIIGRRLGTLPGVCAALLYLTVPSAQRLMCAVMVDHVTAFFSVATIYGTLRYLESPTVGRGILCAVIAALGMLSKYSAAYLISVPAAAMLLLGRFSLIRTPGFLLQPFLFAAAVAPWVLSTRQYAFYGLPAHRPMIAADRIFSFVYGTFALFPAWLIVFVAAGLLGAWHAAKYWRVEVCVTAAVYILHLALLILSPVGPEPRYLLTPAACLLIAAGFGWAGTLAAPAVIRWRPAIAAAGGLAIAAVTALSVIDGSSLPPPTPIRAIADAIAAGHKPKTIFVADTVEGPFIAQYVVQDRHRPHCRILRGSKLLAKTDWFGGGYRSLVTTPDDVRAAMQAAGVDIIVWRDPQTTVQPHERLLGDMLRQPSSRWRRRADLLPAQRESSGWAVYEHTAVAGRL